MTKDEAGELMQLVAEHVATQKAIPSYEDAEFTNKLNEANAAESRMWGFIKGLIK